MGYITLSPEDREKYGAPEKLPFQYGRWGLKVIDALEEHVVEVPVGETEPRSWTIEDLHNAMRRKKIRNGEVVQVPVLDDNDEPVLDNDGKPKLQDLTAPTGTAICVVVWMALWANGIRIHDWASFDIDPAGLTIAWADEDEPGKAPEPEG